MAEQPGSAQTIATPRGREQWRAYYAIVAIDRLKDPTLREDYTRRAQGLPAMIQNLGLAGTTAFLLSKKSPDQRLVGDLSEWLLSSEAGVGWTQQAVNYAGGNVPCPLEAAISHQSTSSFTYRRATKEAKRYATWLKRWSQATSGAQQFATTTAEEAANGAK